MIDVGGEEVAGETFAEKAGPLKNDVQQLVDWLQAEVRPDVVHLSNVMLAGLALPLGQRLGVGQLLVAGREVGGGRVHRLVHGLFRRRGLLRRRGDRLGRLPGRLLRALKGRRGVGIDRRGLVGQLVRLVGFRGQLLGGPGGQLGLRLGELIGRLLQFPGRLLLRWAGLLGMTLLGRLLRFVRRLAGLLQRLRGLRRVALGELLRLADLLADALLRRGVGLARGLLGGLGMPGGPLQVGRGLLDFLRGLGQSLDPLANGRRLVGHGILDGLLGLLGLLLLLSGGLG